MYFIIFGILYVLVTIAAVLHVILYGSRPIRSLSWLLFLILLPFIGILLYILFGVSRRTNGLFNLKETRKRREYDEEHDKINKVPDPITFQDKKNKKLTKMLKKCTGYPAYSGNQVTVLEQGKEMFETLFEALENAEKFIHAHYYIFEKGELLDRFYKIIKKKINEGVEVRLLFDAIGSYELSRKTIKKFKDIGADIYTTMPLSYGSFIFTLNYRNHRKILIIDGILGFTGGFNLSDKYIKKDDELGIWDDTHCQIAGPVVDSLHRVFIKDYYFASDGEDLANSKYLPEQEEKGDVAVQIVAAGPDSTYPAIMLQYITMIDLADEYLFISNPYFIPNSAMMESLRIAALSGTKIKILVPDQTDSWLAKNSMFSNFEELLSIGIEIYLQESAFLHSKLIVMDGEIVSIGSGNFDHRSFEHNFETNALIYDKEVTDSVCKSFLESCKNGVKLEYETYINRPWKYKFSEGVARFFSPLL